MGDLMNSYKHTVTMTTGLEVVVVIKAESEEARQAFLKAFLEHYKDDKYFMPEGSETLYNKEHIFSCVPLKDTP